jgi:hypothetical protein
MELPTHAEALVVVWQCQTCARDCVAVGDESRCICNHRHREHTLTSKRGGQETFVCSVARCPCRRFFYHVTTGSWNCRCRCKHKHIDHDPSSAPYACNTRGCACTGFDSPFVCNCDHGWCDHRTVLKRKRVLTMHGRMLAAGGGLGEGIETLADVARGVGNGHEEDEAGVQQPPRKQPAGLQARAAAAAEGDTRYDTKLTDGRVGMQQPLQAQLVSEIEPPRQKGRLTLEQEMAAYQLQGNPPPRRWNSAQEHQTHRAVLSAGEYFLQPTRLDRPVLCMPS